MSLFLTEDELVDLTGRKYAKYQIAVLTQRKWKFELDGNGHPKVLRSYAEARMGDKPINRKRVRLDGLAAA